MTKIYVNQPAHFFSYSARIAALMCNMPVELVIVDEEMAASKEFKDKKAHGKFPMLESASGDIVFESNAIAAHIAREAGNTALLGDGAWNQAQVNQWMWVATTHQDFTRAIAYNILGYADNAAQFADATKNIKNQIKMINEHLKNSGNDFLVGNAMSLADIANFVMLIPPFAFVLDAGFRKAMPKAAAWFEKMCKADEVIKVCGHVKMCAKSMKPAGKLAAAPAAPKKEEAKKEEPKKETPAAKDDDDFDPFADDDDEDEEAKLAALELKHKAAVAKANKPKKTVIAKSLVIWDVKPWGEETDLDELAKMVLQIEQDGLVWKTEYKKAPIAFGVEKLVIGAVIEDEKVSTDDIQEKIEAFDEMVQSVDIAAFNKL